MEVQARKRRNSKPESTLANKVIKLISNRNPPKRDEDSDEQLSQSTSYSQSTAPVITDPPLCGSCKQTAVVDSTDVTCLQCCLCDEYFHGSCLEVANETLLDFLYVVSEIGGWCCTSCRLIKKVASKPSKGSKASHQQDHVNQELQIIKNQLSILTTNLLSFSNNSINAPSGDHTDHLSDMDRLLSSGNSSGFLSKKSYAEIVGSQQSGSVERKIGGVETIPSLSGGVRTAILSAVHTELQTKDKRAYNIVITGMPISGIASMMNHVSERGTILNARSLNNKLPELHHLLYSSSPSLVLVSETWLSSAPNSLLDPSNLYTVLRCDRPNDVIGGGSCAFVPRSWHCSQVDINIDSISATCCEMVCFDIFLNNSKFRFFVVYRPPCSKFSSQINTTNMSLLTKLLFDFVDQK